MRSITSNAEFFAALKQLIDSWCDRRALKPLAKVLGPYLAFNGLTDGWGELLNALNSIRTSCPHDLSKSQTEVLGELIRTAEGALYGDQNSARDTKEASKPVPGSSPSGQANRPVTPKIRP
jgi:hypothetical protein